MRKETIGSSPNRVVVKVGTSSITNEAGEPDLRRIENIAGQVGALTERGISVVLVSSGAIACGLAPLGFKRRPTDMASLQAAAAIGQRRLMDLYAGVLEKSGLVVAQVLVTRQDMVGRKSYVNALNTIEKLLKLGAVPVVNENDTVATEEIRYGDNDLLAALVANIVKADLLVMLSDVEGLYTSRPGRAGAELIEVVDDLTPEMARGAKGRSALGSGGMASKLEAVRIAVLSGVAAVIASSSRPDVLLDACAGRSVGTYFRPATRRPQARKLWIAWAPSSKGQIVVDGGAVEAISEGNRSLLAAGVTAVEGNFEAGDAVEIVGPEGLVVAKGIVSFDSGFLAEIAGTRAAREVIHRDQLVLL